MKRNATRRRQEHALFAGYREWLGALPATCVVSGQPAVDLAHIRNHTGAAMKPPPWHCLPMAREYHDRQETMGLEFFTAIGIANPIREAEEMFAIYNTRDLISAAEWASARLLAIRAQVVPEKLQLLMEGE